jgi:thiol-disulfide isomerase/thioredoxin
VGWVNTEPFTLQSLRGKVVLIDFWTYTCVNCIRTFPFLKGWHDQYAEYGLVIVGVHSPEFEFEKIRENVVAAAAQYDLRYRIVQDNLFATWQAYRNRAWPSKYLYR